MPPDPFADWYVHPVTVRTLTGSSFDGAKTFEEHGPVRGWLAYENQLQVTLDGQTVTATAQLNLPLGAAPWFTPGSQVTVPNGDVMTVIGLVNQSVGGETGDELEGVTVSLR